MKKILKTFYSNSVLFSLLLTISAFFVSFALNGFAIRAHTDDLLVSVNIHNGYYDTIFINWFLSAVLIPIQKVFPGLNVFVLFQFIFNSLSFFVIIYAIMNSKKANFTIKISIALFFAIFFSSFCFIQIQWTITAAIVSTSGFVLLFAVKSQSAKGRVLNFVIAVIMLLYAAFLRSSAFLAVSAFWGIVLFVSLFLKFIAVIKSGDFNVKREVKRTIKTLICLILVIVIPYVLGFVSENIKASTIPGYTNYVKYNSARAAVVDYGVPDFEDNKDYYENIGITSQNDLDVYKTWIYDKDYYSTTKLQGIKNLAKSKTDVSYQFSFELVYNLIMTKISQLIPINPVIVLSLIFVLFIVSALLLFRFRNKIRFVFPAILILLWIGFFYVFKLNWANCVFLIISFMAILISLFYNRYHYILCLCISIVSMGLYAYLNFGRPLFHATFTVFFPPVVCLLLLILDTNNLREYNKTLFKNKKVKTIGVSVLLSAALIFSSVYGILLWPLGVRPRDNYAGYKYFKDNSKNCIFILDISQYWNQPSNMLLYEDFSENIYPIGWLDGAEYGNNKNKNLGVDNLYNAMLKKDDIYFITNHDWKKLIEQFYKEHYDSEIEVKLIKQFDEYGVYSVQK